MTLLKRIPPLFYLIILFIMTHGLMLLFHGPIGDGSIAFVFEKYHDTAALHALIKAIGFPVTEYVMRLLWLVPANSIKYPIIFFMVLMAIMILQYSILSEMKVLSRTAVFVITLFIIIYSPNWSITFSRASVHQLFSSLMFFLAFYLSMHRLRGIKDLSWQEAIFSRPITRLLVLGLFFVSFFQCSFLVFYALYIMCHYLENYDYQLSVSGILDYIKKNIDFFLLPFAFWLVRLRFFLPQSSYEQYNQFHHFGLKIILRYLYAEIPVNFRPNFMFGFLAIILLFVFLTMVCKKYQSVKLDQERKIYFNLLLVGCLTWVLGILPFILVGKFISPPRDFVMPGLAHALNLRNFYELQRIYKTRFLQLSSIGAAIVFAGLILFAFINDKKKLRAIGVFVVVIYSSLFILTWWKTYFSWFGALAARQSIILQLKDHPKWKNYSYYTVFDRRISTYFGPFYLNDWSAVMDQAYGGRSRLAGLDSYCTQMTMMYGQDYKGELAPQNLYAIPNLQRHGKRAFLLFEQLRNAPAYVIGIEYLKTKYFHPEKLPDFLRSISGVAVMPDRVRYNCQKKPSKPKSKSS